MRNILALTMVAGVVAGGVWYALRRPRIAGESAADGSVCAEHGLAPAECPWCDPTLVEKLGMCAGHGVPEALCWKCHDKLVAAFKKKNDWCAGHDCPESLCKICNGEGGSDKPAAERAGQDAPRAAAAPAGAINGDGTISPTRHSQAPNARCETGKTLVTLADAETVRRAGLEFAPVERKPISQTISCNAQLGYDLNRFARLTPRAPGLLSEVRVDLGSALRRGDVLAVVDSAEFAQAKADYLQAVASLHLAEKNSDRERELHERSGTPMKDLLEAEARLISSQMDVRKASLRLHTLGWDDSRVQGLEQSKDLSSLLELVAPFDGLVVERSAVVGESVDTTRALFAVADTSRMWAMLDLHSSDAALLALGQPVQVDIDGASGPIPEARISWISTEVDPRTRTLKARAELHNASSALRANMFAHAKVRVLEEQPLLTVPKPALQWDGCCNIVFVRKSEREFEPRKVSLGYETQDLVEIRGGVTEGESVVTTGSYLLKTEIMKSSIGAGCCPDD
ncbi:MAG: efflux RND transporter periplasmic adaptor subunit [Phycisphaerales bacterium]|nr:efflux RND transporter periplasmic adaptor subunit [Phycisphaerales bacterium]